MMLRTTLLCAAAVIALLPLNNLGAQATETGFATYYADYLHGRQTAYGEIYNRDLLTCAHKKHPLGTLLKVTRLDNNQSVSVRVNDRGPFVEGYVVDLSYRAANQIGLDLVGKAMVKVEVVGFSEQNLTDRGATAYNYGPARTTEVQARGDATTPTSYGNTGIMRENTNYANVSVADIRRVRQANDGFGIQLASYSILANAERQAQALKAQGVTNLYLMESPSPSGQVLYKVLVGKFQTRDAAANYLLQLRQQFRLNGFVTQM